MRETRPRELIELARVECRDTRMRDRRRLQCNEVVGGWRCHLKVLPAVVDEDPYLRVLQYVVIGLPEIGGVLEDVSREVCNVDLLHRRVERGSVRGVPDAKSNHEDSLGVLDREQRNVRERTHVALIEARR